MRKICCERCGTEIDKDVIALNKKLISKYVKEFFCIRCLADYLDTNEEALFEKIEQFKEEGCALFL